MIGAGESRVSIMSVNGPGIVRGTQTTVDAVRRRDSLRTRIALWSGTLNLLLLLCVVLAIAWFARKAILEDAYRNTRANALETAQRLDTSMHTVTITAHGLSDLVANAQLDPEELTTTLRAMARATPGVNGGLLILEPRAGRRQAFARYIAANGKDRDFVAEGYDYKARAWYQRTLAAPGGWWSEPYVNRTAGDVWMVTYNMPLRPAGRGAATRGMVSLDLPLSHLTDSFESLANLPGWRVTLVAPAGTIASIPDPGVALEQTLDEYIRSRGRGDLAQAAKAVRLHQSTQYTHVDARMGEKRYTVVEPVGTSGWSLLVAQSYDLIVARLDKALYLLLATGALLALASTLVVRRLAKRISRPVEHLADSTIRLARGQYDWPVPHTGRGDEVGRMARTLEHARLSIQQQLTEIRQMGTARQKLESELSIARDIQLSMLSPGRVIQRNGARLEAYAQLEAATAVGGDFYCFIERGDGALWFAIGDVSDKGVPAALFMARAITVLEVAAHAYASPDQALAEASRRLVEGNETCMFATVLCGHVDVASGRCILANAAHEAPLLLHADGRVETIEMESGPPLGFEISTNFPLWHRYLEPGTTLLAYTDGVTEAFNAANVAFGEAQLRSALGSGYSARENCERVIAQVHAYAGSAAQSDDITMLAIRLGPAPGRPQIPIGGSRDADTTDRAG